MGEVAMKNASIVGAFSPFDFVPEKNFGAGGGARTLVETDRQYSDQSVVWQRDVYEFAREACEEQEALRVVDFGAGAGHKFIDAFKGRRLKRVQIDWDDRREAVLDEDAAEKGRFIEADFEAPADLERIANDLGDDDCPTVFLLSDVIEHLSDPRPILSLLRRLLRQDSRNRLVISTPDRERIDGLHSSRAPDNLGHVRQWTLNEFGLALQAAGFQVCRIGHVPQNNFDSLDRTVLAEVRCDDEAYAAYLQSCGLPQASDHLVITSEHADCLATGGIGTYHRFVTTVAGQRPLYLFAGAHGLPAEWSSFVRSKGWLHVADFGQDKAAVQSLDPDEVLRATLHALFIYDTIRLVEFQDFQGLGSRVAQAKRAGLISPLVTVVADAHGSHFYLENALGKLDQAGSLQVHAHERVSLEQADAVIFASRFAEDLYVSKQGLVLRDIVRQAYPIRLRDHQRSDLQRGPIDTLVFYGKQTPQKGYPEFCDAVVELFERPEFADAARHITRVVLMGVTSPDSRLTGLSGVAVTHGSFDRQSAVAKLRDCAAGALVVLPYKADNHPLSIYEVVDSDCQLLAYATGGIPEVVPTELHEALLCKPNVRSLASAMAKAVRTPFWDRCRLLDRTFELFQHQCVQQTNDFVETIAQLKARGRAPERRPRGSVSLVVPNLNGEQHFFDDLALGVRNSFHRPEHVYFVDDGSDELGKTRLEEGAAKVAPVPYTTIFNAENKGLAATRNIGVAQVRTPYVCAHDNDNIILNAYLGLACRILDENPDVAAVTAYHHAFVDGSEWKIRRAQWDYHYNPVGQDMGLGLRENVFGDALAVYRVEALRSLGGWDGTSKGLWEDWQLFLRMTAAGMKVAVIPLPMFLYRLRPNSMLKTYDRLPGELRLARSLGLPVADAIGVIRSLSHALGQGDGAGSSDFGPYNAMMQDLASKALRRLDAEQVAFFGLKRLVSKGVAGKSLSIVAPKRSPRINDRRLIEICGLYDEDWYRARNPDLVGWKGDLIDHYLHHGGIEGRCPGPHFDGCWYLWRYSDVKEAKLNPLIHYLRYGAAEGRLVQSTS